MNYGKVYLHVGNGGFTFEIVDGGMGPSINIRAGFFGHKANEMNILTNKKSLIAIRDLINKSLEGEFSTEYYESAKVK